MTIKLSIPKFAADLIISGKTSKQVFADMVDNLGLTFRELVTFGMVITPIEDSEGREISHVTYWEDDFVSVTKYIPGENFMPLLGFLKVQNPPTLDEALEIFYRYVNLTQKAILPKTS